MSTSVVAKLMLEKFSSGLSTTLENLSIFENNEFENLTNYFFGNL